MVPLVPLLGIAFALGPYPAGTSAPPFPVAVVPVSTFAVGCPPRRAGAACALRNAGYAGAEVADTLNGGFIDTLTWTRRQVDAKFAHDVRRVCGQRAACIGRAPGTRRARFAARPRLGGTWHARGQAWHLTQSARHVTASWPGGTFDGTLITTVHLSAVDGLAWWRMVMDVLSPHRLEAISGGYVLTLRR
jgi:hypothetical protein